MTLISSTVAILATGLALTACASDSGPPPGPRGVPPTEAPRVRMFISPAGQPFRGRPGESPPIERWWRQVDENGDGVVTREEFRQDALAFFKPLDRNGDGAIDGFEVAAYETEIVPEIIPEVGGPGAPEGRADRAAGAAVVAAAAGAAVPRADLLAAAQASGARRPWPSSA